MTPLFLTNRKVHWTALGILLTSGVLLCLWISGQRAVVPALGDYHIYQCDTGGAETAPVYKLLLVSSVRARDIAERLCAAPSIQRSFSRVQVSWKPRAYLTAEQILGEDYDLIWSRAHSMAGLVPEYGDYYEPLLHYDHYRVYWYSRGGAPQLTADYFHGKRIGLLNDKLSHTLYLLPLASLKEAGVSFSEENLRYFDDAESLYQAFARDELDLVSGGDYVRADLDLPLARTLISGDVIAATLFVRKNRVAAADCAVAAAFDGFADAYLQGGRASVGAEHCAP